MIEIKLCGLKEPSHIKLAFDLGIKYVGLVFFEKSSRFLSFKAAKSLISVTPPEIKKVGLVVNPNDYVLDMISSLGLDMLQLHGSESISRVKEIKSNFDVSVIKAIGVKSKNDLKLIKNYAEVADQILIDAKPKSDKSLPGGNGLKFDWKLLENNFWKFPWFLAGGLNENNIGKAITMTQAKKVDLSSGVEDSSGKKSIKKITSFVKRLRECEVNLNAR